MKMVDKGMKWAEQRYDAFWKWAWEQYDFPNGMVWFITMVIFISVLFRLTMLVVIISLFLMN